MAKDRAGAALERLAFFSDAVFAIAMTLLVIEVKVPHIERLTDRALLEGLGALLPSYIGFVVGFVVIARFWIGHHRIIGMLAAVPPRLVQINFVLLLTIAFMPFPTAVLSDYVQLGAAVTFYALWLVVTGIANIAVVRTVLGDATLLRPEITPQEIRATRHTCWIPIVVGLLAAAAAFLSPALGILTLMGTTPIVGAILNRVARRSPAVGG